LIEAEESIQPFAPVLHIKGLPAGGLFLGVVQIHGHDPVQALDLGLVEVIFGDGDVMFSQPGAAPCGEAHIGLFRVRAFRDDFGGGLAGDGEVELVLDDLEEFLSGFGPGVVINGELIDVLDLLIEALFRGPDVADALQEYIEIVRAQGFSLFKALVIHDKALDQVFAQMLGGPLAELGAPEGPDPVAHGEDHVEVIMSNEPFHAPAALGSNYSILSNSCPGGKLLVLINALYMVVYRANAHLIEFGEKPLSEPYGLPVQNDLDPAFTVLALIKEDFRGRNLWGHDS